MRAEPHSNGVAESANGVISNKATSLLHEAKLPPSFWTHAVSMAIYTHNRIPTSALPNITPHVLEFRDRLLNGTVSLKGHLITANAVFLMSGGN